MSTLNIKDATWLFQRRSDTSRSEPFAPCENSESWWTALFSFLLMQNNKCELKTYQYLRAGDLFQQLNTWSLPITDYNNLYVETPIKRITALKISESCKPDISIVCKSKQEIHFIEIKTVAAKSDSLELYVDIASRLCQQNWKAKVHLLASVGNPQEDLWIKVHELQEKQKKNNPLIGLLLWENVFETFANNSLLASIVPKPDKLSTYYEDALRLKVRRP
jgi:hypothetical protein